MNTLHPIRIDEPHDAISDRAADFFAQRRFGPWHDADQSALDAWLAESDLHRVAYLRLEGIAARTSHLAAIHTFKSGARSSRFQGMSAGWSKYRLYAAPLLIAASLTFVAPYVGSLVNALFEPPLRSFSTDVGGRTLLRFGDGTEFELNTNSAVHYRMSNHERSVWLDRGEVWFHVAHDPKNPFVLNVGSHRVSDLGTEFVVRRNSANVEVALLNGRAILSTDGMQTAMLTPGDDAVATTTAISVARKTPQELDDALAWRKGVLVFRSTRLEDVIREVNRYSATQLVIADPSVAALKFTGEITTRDFEDFLALAQAALCLRVDRQGDEILISRMARKTKTLAHNKRGE
jgi:transmembrane sensor